MRRLSSVPLVLLITTALVGVLFPALAVTVPGRSDVPRIAIVARGDNPIDALASAPIAGASGGIVVLTTPTSLQAVAKQALIDFDPDVVILAGGEAALSKAVFDAVAAAGPWDTRRVSGGNRYDTAAALSAVLAEYGLDGLDVSDAVPAAERTTYVQAASDDLASGQSLLDAMAAVPALGPGETWTVRIGPGVFDLGTKQLVVPAGVTVIGDGALRTRITSERGAITLQATAGVLRAGAGVTLDSLAVRNEGGGAVAVAVWYDDYGYVRNADLGQNLAGGDSYGFVANGSFEIYDSAVSGMSSGSDIGTAILAQTGYGAFIEDSVVYTQGTSAGAAIHVTSGFTGYVIVRRSRVGGFAAAQAFINDGPGNIEILFSELEQDGADGTVNDGTVRIASTQREHTITENGSGVATCIYNFKPDATAISC